METSSDSNPLVLHVWGNNFRCKRDKLKNSILHLENLYMQLLDSYFLVGLSYLCSELVRGVE